MSFYCRLQARRLSDGSCSTCRLRTACPQVDSLEAKKPVSEQPVPKPATPEEAPVAAAPKPRKPKKLPVEPSGAMASSSAPKVPRTAKATEARMAKRKLEAMMFLVEEEPGLYRRVELTMPTFFQLKQTGKALIAVNDWTQW